MEHGSDLDDDVEDRDENNLDSGEELIPADEDFRGDSDSESGVGGVGGENNKTVSFLHSDWYLTPWGDRER